MLFKTTNPLIQIETDYFAYLGCSGFNAYI